MDQGQQLAEQNAAVRYVALSILGIKTLDSQNSDQLDFYDLSIGSIRAALEAAYKAGRSDGERNK